MRYQVLGLLLTLSFIITCRSIVPLEGSSPQFESKIYIANSGSNTISVIDVNSDKVIKTIKTGEEPVSIAISPDELVLAVANKSSKDIWLINTKNDKVFSKIPLVNKFEPLKLVFGDTNLILIAVYKYGVGTQVVSLDLGKPTQVDTIAKLSHIGADITEMVVSRKHKILCISGEINPLIDFAPNENQPGTVINYQSKEVIVRAYTNGFGAVITPDEKYIYVNNLLGYFIKWDVETHTSYPIVITTHAGDMVYKKDDEIKVFYRVHSGYPSLNVVSLEDTTYTSYPLPYHGDYLVLSNLKNYLYIIHRNRDELSVFDLSKMAIIKTIPVGQTPNDIVILE